MRAGVQARTVFAGFGVTGSLLAAVGTISLLAGGVLAFDRWPGSSAAVPEAVLNVASAPGATQRAAQAVPVALPPAAAPVAASAPVGAGRGGVTVAGRKGNEEGAATVAPSGSLPGAPGVPSEPSVQGPGPGGRDNGLVATTTSNAARAVRSAGAAVPAAAPVTDLVAAAFDQAGTAVGGLLPGR
jgi:hypothetical protein